MKLYVVRHGITDSNIRGLVNGRNDEDININGITQAIRLQHELLNRNIEIVISSPLRRARHTAEILNTTGKPVILDNRIIERDTGAYMYYPFERLNGKKLDELNHYSIEPLENVRRRVNFFINDIKKYQRNVLIVTHGDVASLIKENLTNSEREADPPNCILLEFDLK